MTTAIDSSVLFDVFLPDPQFAESSKRALEECATRGTLVVSAVVYAELLGRFADRGQLDAALGRLEITVDSLSESAAALAGEGWKAYRRAGGARSRILTDFLIAGHALDSGAALLTRDRGFFRQHFSGLQVIDPTQL
jgi:predicted nucleic acid-binding protein